MRGWIGAALGEELSHDEALRWASEQVALQEAEPGYGDDGYMDILQRAWRAAIPPEQKIPFAEVYDLLRRVGLGELVPRLAPGERPWERSGWHVHFVVAGYELWVFNDDDSWDYINDMTAPDGRTALWFDWGINSPEIHLAREEPALSQQMELAFKRAR